MKKLMIVAAALAVGITALVRADSLGNTAKTAYIDVTAAQIAYTNVVNYGDLYKTLDQLVFKNDTAVTVTATTYAVCGTLNVATLNTSAISAGSSATVTNLAYITQKVKTIFTLGGTNGVAKAAGIESTVFGYGK